MSFPPHQPFGRPPQMMPHGGFMPAWLPPPPVAPSVPPAPAPPVVVEPAKPKSSIAAAALQSAKMKRDRQMIVQSLGPKKPVVESAALEKPAVSSSTQAPTASEQAASAPAPAEAQASDAKRRKRWDVLESDAPSALTSSAIIEAVAPPSTELARSLKKPNDYEEQLRAQKEIQFLEARIRSMRGDKSEADRLDALHKERLKHYAEYGSDDEDPSADPETWEHRKRAREMMKTAEKALEYTRANQGKHFIGDFLPKEELERLKKEAEAVRRGETYVHEDFADNKLDATNKGFNMLQKAGWVEGTGLGSTASGRVAPVSAVAPTAGGGVGIAPTHKPEATDDDFDEYRKRMMLAYRFRPNPMNNPRRAYY